MPSATGIPLFAVGWDGPEETKKIQSQEASIVVPEASHTSLPAATGSKPQKLWRILQESRAGCLRDMQWFLWNLRWKIMWKWDGEWRICWCVARKGGYIRIDYRLVYDRVYLYEIPLGISSRKWRPWAPRFFREQFLYVSKACPFAFFRDILIDTWPRLMEAGGSII